MQNTHRMAVCEANAISYQKEQLKVMEDPDCPPQCRVDVFQDGHYSGLIHYFVICRGSADKVPTEQLMAEKSIAPQVEEGGCSVTSVGQSSRGRFSNLLSLLISLFS